MTSYGEYEFVVRKVYSEKAIKKAHEIKISRGNALRIINELSKRYFKNENIVRVVWMSKNAKMNMGGVMFDCDERTPVIELVNTKSNLRVGIVLHEFSHAFTGYHYRKVNHGKSFIRTFNKILRFYFNNLQKKIK